MRYPTLAKAFQKLLDVTEIRGSTAVWQGINGTYYRYSTEMGSFLVKNCPDVDENAMAAEVKGLTALMSHPGLRIPQPLFHGTAGAQRFLILEDVDFRPPQHSDRLKFAATLARMHATRTAWSFGFEASYDLGYRRLSNPWTKDWLTFFKEYRLAPIIGTLAGHRDSLPLAQRLSQVLGNLMPLFQGVAIFPCLLYGNFGVRETGVDANGDWVILDPLAFYGHSELELSALEACHLFPPEFFQVYFQHLAPSPGFQQRRLLYRLYHLINQRRAPQGPALQECFTLIDQLS